MKIENLMINTNHPYFNQDEERADLTETLSIPTGMGTIPIDLEIDSDNYFERVMLRDKLIEMSKVGALLQTQQYIDMKLFFQNKEFFQEKHFRVGNVTSFESSITEKEKTYVLPEWLRASTYVRGIIIFSALYMHYKIINPDVCISNIPAYIGLFMMTSTIVINKLSTRRYKKNAEKLMAQGQEQYNKAKRKWWW